MEILRSRKVCHSIRWKNVEKRVLKEQPEESQEKTHSVFIILGFKIQIGGLFRRRLLLDHTILRGRVFLQINFFPIGRDTGSCLKLRNTMDRRWRKTGEEKERVVRGREDSSEGSGRVLEDMSPSLSPS
jgi:hypothetical protein